MNLTGNILKGRFQSLSRLFTALGAILVLLAGSGCTNTQNVRRANPMPVNTPENVEIVESEAPDVSEADAEVAEATPEAPADPVEEEAAVSPEAEILAAVAKGENGVAEALQETRGAVFASLTTPAGAGPPASVVKTSDGDPSEVGLQDSATQLTGDAEIPAEAEEAESGTAIADEEPPPEEETASENENAAEEAEAGIAETTPVPEPNETQELVETPEVEAVKVAPPPEPEPAIVPQDAVEEGLTSRNPATGEVEGGTQSKTASVLFLILGGVGATLILLRKRAAA